MMSASSPFDCAGETHVGCVRTHNEDGFLSNPEVGLWVVADGMGGHEAGEVASANIISGLSQVVAAASPPELLKACEERLVASNREIRSLAIERNVDVIGSTVVILLIFDSYFACLWSGDSRAYLIRGREISQITRDHTELEDLIASGQVTEQEAQTWPMRNVITRAIGVFDEPEVDMNHGALDAGDTFILCSDGLTNHVEAWEIREIVRNRTAEDGSQRLVQLALDRGGRDNVTVVVINYRPTRRATTVVAALQAT